MTSTPSDAGETGVETGPEESGGPVTGSPETSGAASGSPGTSGAASGGAAGGSIETGIEPWLRDILRCPNCRSELADAQGESGPELHCTDAECGLQYRIDDGVPVLLVDEARKPA